MSAALNIAAVVLVLHEFLSRFDMLKTQTTPTLNIKWSWKLEPAWFFVGFWSWIQAFGIISLMVVDAF